MRTSLLRFSIFAWLLVGYGLFGWAQVRAQEPLRMECPVDFTHWVCGVESTARVSFPIPAVTGGTCRFPATVTCSPPSGAVFILGTTLVTCTATNRCGERVTCRFRVTVARDTAPPVLQCLTNRTIWVCGTATAVPVIFRPPVATDNADGDPSVVCSPPSGSLFPVGTTTVTCVAADNCKNRSTCEFTVTVARDTRPPVLQCPPALTAITCSPGGTVVNYPVPTATDNVDAKVTVTCTPPSGSVFPVGTTPVVCTATDDCNNRSSCTFMVTVKGGGNPPTLHCPENITLQSCNPRGEVVNYPPPVVIFGDDPRPTLTCTPPSGSVFPPGVTVVTCRATDDCGHTSTCSFEVRVMADTTPPVIECPADRVVYACQTAGQPVAFPNPSADDNSNTAPVVTCVPASQSHFPLGTTVVTCTAVDACGNRSQCTFRVTVLLDLEPPVIKCPRDITVISCDPRGVVVLWPKPEVTDNHLGTLQHKCEPSSGSVFPVGVTVVTCEARDVCGLRSQCTFKVTVIADTEVAGTDINGDGLSDIWQAHFGAFGLAPGDDTDLDGSSNAAEAAAGTDPRNAADGLRLVGARAEGCKAIECLVQVAQMKAVTGKLYQLQHARSLQDRWTDVGAPVVGTLIGKAIGDFANEGGEEAPMGFFRVRVLDLDQDGDGVTAWEESIVGTSDLGPNTRGDSGGDRQTALDWIAGNAAPARLREVALAHIGGSPGGPTQTQIVTAAGTGGWFKLSSWTLNPGTLDPTHLQDTAPLEGWNAKLHVLEGPVSPSLGLNPFISGRIREDQNLWLTTRRVDAAGAHAETETLGYGVNASLRVYEYAMAHRTVMGTGNQVERFILITPVMGLNTANQRELRIVTWQVHPFTGDLQGLLDTGSLGHINLPPEGGRLQIVPEVGERFVVSYLSGSDTLATWFFDVGPTGLVLARSGGTSGTDLRGDFMEPVSATDFALGPLNASGFVTLLSGSDCAGKLAVWEDRVRVAADTTATGEPYLISDNSLDLHPNDAGVQIVPPILSDSIQDGVAAHEEFGRAIAAGDFNGDGWDDLVIGVPGQAVAKDGAAAAGSAGVVNVLYGRKNGPNSSYPDRSWSQDSEGLLGEAETGDAFGHALATGDFNGDGYVDLAVGAPFEDVGDVASAGAVSILYCSSVGLGVAGNQLWYQGLDGLPGTPGADDWFGYALATGDFNGDGRVDLAIGVPHETVNAFTEAGAVQILFGSASGLSATAGPGTQYLHQDTSGVWGAAESGDHFGITLAAGDIDHDGRADLVVGIPQEKVGDALNAGAVQILFGGAAGAGAHNQLITQGHIEPEMQVFPGVAETGDSFGWSVAAGDFDGDGFADVAIGVPYENLVAGDLSDAGVVQILRGSAAGVTAAGQQLLSQVLAESGDAFGFSVATGDFNGDGRADLAVGVVNEDVVNNSVSDAGAVDVFHGGAGALTYSTSFFQGALGNEGYEEMAEAFDRFGFVVASGDLNGDGRDDLLVGAPKEALVRDDENQVQAGVVHAVFGSATGLSGLDDQVWSQGELRRVRALLTEAQREETGGVTAGKLFERMPSGERTNVHVASVTKTMTLLLAVELMLTPGANVAIQDSVTVSELAAGTGGSHVDLPYGVPLAAGDTMPLELLLQGMMQRSCNKSSVAIAEHLGRKQYQFLHGNPPNDFDACGYFVATMMQGKATNLAMVNTLFGHPAGGTITSPQDLVNLWRHGWQFSEFRRFSTDTSWIDQGKDAQGQPKIWSLEKHSAETGYPGLEGWKGGNGGLWKGSFPFGIPICTSSVLGQATRLERSLIFALEQTGNRWGDVRQLLDYGFRLLFTPDYRGGGGINTPPITDFAVRKIHDTLAVSAIIHGAGELRLDAWQVVAGIGQVTPLNASSITVNNLAVGTHAVRTKLLDVTRLPSVGESEADYLTGHLKGGDLRLNVWRVAAEPGQ